MKDNETLVLEKTVTSYEFPDKYTLPDVEAQLGGIRPQRIVSAEAEEQEAAGLYSSAMVQSRTANELSFSGSSIHSQTLARQVRDRDEEVSGE